MKYGKRDNEIAATMRKSAVNSDEFLQSPEWKKVRRQVVAHYGRRCMRCGHTPKNPKHTNVDHIKPRKYFPLLALVFDNLQVLCGRCNKEKGNKIADYRGKTHRQRIKNFEYVDWDEIHALRSLARCW